MVQAPLEMMVETIIKILLMAVMEARQACKLTFEMALMATTCLMMYFELNRLSWRRFLGVQKKIFQCMEIILQVFWKHMMDVKMYVVHLIFLNVQKKIKYKSLFFSFSSLMEYSF